MKLIFVVTALFTISTVVILRANALTCFSCGYKEDKDGHRTEIDDPRENITYCGTDKLSNSSTVPTEVAAPVTLQFNVPHFVTFFYDNEIRNFMISFIL